MSTAVVIAARQVSSVSCVNRPWICRGQLSIKGGATCRSNRSSAQPPLCCSVSVATFWDISLSITVRLVDASGSCSTASCTITGWVAVLGLSSSAPQLSLNRSEEHTSELQSRGHLVCRLLLEKKKI